MRQCKSKMWSATFSYSLNEIISDKKISKFLLIALLFIKDKRINNRYTILKRIGVPEDKAAKKGFDTCIFTALLQNSIIIYNPHIKHYERGNRFDEFINYMKSYISVNSLNNVQQEIYYDILKYTSNSMDFLLTE